MFPVIRLVYINKAVRIPLNILPVPVSGFSENFINQPHVKGSVQTYSDRVILTWSSVGYKLNWGNKFNIYVDKETEPIITITPKDNQTSFRWEHRYTDKHSDRQNKTDETTGAPYTEEQNLGACTPHNYRIEGVIDGKKLNEASVEKVAIGSGAQFYSLEATKGSYAGLVKLSWHIDNQGSEKSKKFESAESFSRL